MKTSIRCTLIIFALLSGFSAKACNNSNYSLVSMVTSAGPTYTITTQLCIGYGRTGVVFGADGPTNGSFSIAVHSMASSAAIMAALVSFTPTYAGPPLPGNIFDGIQGGPGYGIFEEDNIIYYDISCLCLDLTCISSTAACGNVGSHCQNLVFVYSSIYPDSLRAIGIEGLAPFGGCGPNPDMLVDLTVLEVVWGEFSGQQIGDGIKLDWNTMKEKDAGNFKVLRAAGQSSIFYEIGTVNAVGNSVGENKYQFNDKNPLQGFNKYKLVQTDVNGGAQESETIFVLYIPSSPLIIEELAPIPAHDFVSANLYSDSERMAEIRIENFIGATVLIKETHLLEGSSSIQLDISSLSPGIYTFSIFSGNKKTMRMLLVQ